MGLVLGAELEVAKAVREHSRRLAGGQKVESSNLSVPTTTFSPNKPDLSLLGLFFFPCTQNLQSGETM